MFYNRLFFLKLANNKDKYPAESDCVEKREIIEQIKHYKNCLVEMGYVSSEVDYIIYELSGRKGLLKASLGELEKISLSLKDHLKIAVECVNFVKESGKKYALKD